VPTGNLNSFLRKPLIVLDTTSELLYFSRALRLAVIGEQSVSKFQISNPSPIGRPLPIVCSHGRVLKQFNRIF
jgi:hypothetical protein